MERSKREKLFQKTFGYFDKGIFNMLTNKFRKLTEEKQFKAKSKETNRVVIFSGEHWHTGQSPKEHSRRVLINSNFI